jgi:hypothetical protein
LISGFQLSVVSCRLSVAGCQFLADISQQTSTSASRRVIRRKDRNLKSEIQLSPRCGTPIFLNVMRTLTGFFVLFLAAAAPLFPENVDLAIRFYNKKIYYTNEEPIYVQITLANNSPNVYRFRIADDRVFSLDFDVRTMRNRPVENADVLMWRRGSSIQVFFREIAIEPGESFSFVEDLRDYARLDEAGSYVVQAKLYPELLKNNAGLQTAPAPRRAALSPAGSAFLVSQRLNLNLRLPLVSGDDGLPQALDVETNAVLVREKLAPDEVVAFMLSARQKSQWEKFFLYLDLEQMILRDAARERRWRAESEDGRRKMVERFRADLQNSVIDGDISAIPTRFDIERTTYNASEGTVIVLERFRQGDYTEKKRYTYHLAKTDEVWAIVDYVVLNLGTE